MAKHKRKLCPLEITEKENRVYLDISFSMSCLKAPKKKINIPAKIRSRINRAISKAIEDMLDGWEWVYQGYSLIDHISDIGFSKKLDKKAKRDIWGDDIC